MEGDSGLRMRRVWQRLGEGVGGPFWRGEPPPWVGRGLCKRPIQGGPCACPGALPSPGLTSALLRLPPGGTAGSCPVLAANLNFLTRLLPSQPPAPMGPRGLEKKGQTHVQSFLTM